MEITIQQSDRDKDDKHRCATIMECDSDYTYVIADIYKFSKRIGACNFIVEFTHTWKKLLSYNLWNN